MPSTATAGLQWRRREWVELSAAGAHPIRKGNNAAILLPQLLCASCVYALESTCMLTVVMGN